MNFPYLPSLSRPVKRFHLSIVWWPRTTQTAASRTRVTAEQTRRHPEVFLGNKTFLPEQKEENFKFVSNKPKLECRNAKANSKIMIFYNTLKDDAVRKSNSHQGEAIALGWTLLCFTHCTSSQLTTTLNFLRSGK